MAKPAPAPSSPFLQLLNELQSSPSVTTLESWLTTNFPKSSAVAATLASIVTQALANNGTITFSTAQASVTLEPLCAAFGFTAPTLPSVLVGNISGGITSLTIDVNNPALEMVGTCTGILPASDPCVFFAAAIDDPENGWALVFGGDLETNFSNFPVIGSPGLAIPLDLAAAFLVVSTGGISDYSIPDQGNFFANYPITFTQAGVMIAALLDLTTNPGKTTCSTNLAYFNNPPQTPQSQPESGNILITADLKPRWQR